MPLSDFPAVTHRFELPFLFVGQAQREGYLNEICHALNAAAVQHIGKLLVIWRPKPEVHIDKSGKATGRRKAPRQLKRNFQNR